MGQAQLRTPTWQCAVCSDGAPPSLSPPDFDGMDTIADIMILDDDENECAPPPRMQRVTNWQFGGWGREADSSRVAAIFLTLLRIATLCG